MKSTRLVARQDPEHGELGLCIDGFLADGMNVGVGRNCGIVIAHDLLEHQFGHRNIGPVGDELIALGAIWFVRGWSGTLDPEGRSHYSPAENLASDITRMARDLACYEGLHYHMPVPKTRESLIEDDINDTLEYVEAELPAELRDMDGEFPIKQYLSDVRHFMRRGYSLAKRRFKNDHNYAYTQFFEIVEAVRNVWKEVEFEGQEFTLLWGGRQARCFQSDWY